ncbi:MAG: hypothetical protein Q9187_004050 [Circinaria calcarea]
MHIPEEAGFNSYGRVQKRRALIAMKRSISIGLKEGHDVFIETGYYKCDYADSKKAGLWNSDSKKPILYILRRKDGACPKPDYPCHTIRCIEGWIRYTWIQQVRMVDQALQQTELLTSVTVPSDDTVFHFRTFAVKRNLYRAGFRWG